MKEDRMAREWAHRAIILNMLVRRGPNEDVQLSQDLNNVTVRALQTIWKESIPGRGKSQCERPGANGSGRAALGGIERKRGNKGPHPIGPCRPMVLEPQCMYPQNLLGAC